MPVTKNGGAIPNIPALSNVSEAPLLATLKFIK